MLSIQK